ncbi:hypothetical protein PAPYR_12961 [Paratrimastix pyriformis]|uniref:Mediator of RNA polymerase II transcription subunit 21 n=1 Tax=Paratrimastix pyriformis TaxID=342808 RepID=A0ABQ8U112_9EUKA|nr:hypothetical protein PAPYR_12961 [Paratrimastix pyriformis]
MEDIITQLHENVDAVAARLTDAIGLLPREAPEFFVPKEGATAQLDPQAQMLARAQGYARDIIKAALEVDRLIDDIGLPSDEATQHENMMKLDQQNRAALSEIEALVKGTDDWLERLRAQKRACADQLIRPFTTTVPKPAAPGVDEAASTTDAPHEAPSGGVDGKEDGEAGAAAMQLEQTPVEQQQPPTAPQ